jgi:hypothetical protein
MLGIVGCADVESIPSGDHYSIISEKRMPEYCKREVSKEFGVSRNEIYLYPIEYQRSAKVIYGRYSIDSKNLEEFACVFNPDDTYAGIKMQHSRVKNALCYPY